MGNNILQVATYIGLFASLIATICYIPGAIKVLKTNDTRAISLTMYILTVFGCFIWIIIGILNMIGNILNDNLWAALSGGLPVTISNLGLGTFGFIILIHKFLNLKRAKAKNLTEEQYFEKYIKIKKRG